MKTITYDNLTNLITNKKVAIVGPADYVNKELNDKHGEYIDSFDIIIRLNSMIKFPEENNIYLTKYYGSKFNILASSFWYENDHKKIINEKYNRSRYIYSNQYNNINHDLILFENTNRNLFKHIYDINKPFFDNHNNFSYCNVPNQKHYNAIQYLNQIYHNNYYSTTGILTIANILLMKPKELYVTGITLYKDTKYNGYYDNYNLFSKDELILQYNNPSYIFDGKNYKPNAIFGHNVICEQKQMEYLIKNNIINVDKYLKSLYI